MRHLGAHANVIGLFDLQASERRDELYLVMALTEQHVKYFMFQLVRGVQYLHRRGVLHRDLKPGNLLVSKNCELRITDFGLARLATGRRRMLEQTEADCEAL